MHISAETIKQIKKSRNIQNRSLRIQPQGSHLVNMNKSANRLLVEIPIYIRFWILYCYWIPIG